MLVPVNGKDAERPNLYFNHVNEMALLALSGHQYGPNILKTNGSIAMK